MMNMHKDPNWEKHWASYQEARRVAEDLLGERKQASAPSDTSLTVSMSQGGDPLISRLFDAVKTPYLFGQDFTGNVHTASVATEEKRETFVEGDILQLSSEFTLTDERRLFIYVLSVSDEGIKVALFSPLSLPASREEIRTGIDTEGLAVLQLWNTKLFSHFVLARSWRVEEADTSLQEDVRTLLQWEDEGGDLPDSLAERLGGPVVSPLDVRWSYFEEETQLLENLESGFQAT